MLRYLAPLGIFIILVIFFAIGLNLDPKIVHSPLIDKPGPAFSLPLLKQAEHVFSNKDFQGKVSLFNVWASWCAACRVEHPFLLQLAKNNVVPIYGLNYKDTRQDALNWLANFENPYTLIAFDEAGRVGLDWGVYGVPETFIIDKKGIIRYKHIGPLNPNTWNTTLYPMIKKLQAEQI